MNEEETFFWRIRSRKDRTKFYRSGMGLYAKNGRSIWAKKAGAVRALDEMIRAVQDDAEIVKYRLVEVETGTND